MREPTGPATHTAMYANGLYRKTHVWVSASSLHEACTHSSVISQLLEEDQRSNIVLLRKLDVSTLQGYVGELNDRRHGLERF